MSSDPHETPETAAHRAAMRATPQELVAGLRDLLGARLVALIAGVGETRAIREWAEGARVIRNPDVLPRLRLAYQAALLVSQRNSAAVAQAWMQGMNPYLSDQSPAMVLRDGEVEEAGPRVLAAARQFVEYGCSAENP